MDDDFHSWRGQGGAEVVKRAIEMSVRGQLRIGARLAKEVESEESLFEEVVSENEREIRMSAAQSSDEVVLEGLDGSFSEIATMEAGRRELVSDVLFIHVILHHV